jgi:hypothetical protein
MSIYQGWKHLPSDLHRADAENDVRPRPASQPAREHERRARPVLILLPRTAHWMASLPESVRPKVLAATIPRIANHLAANWSESQAFHSYMRELTEDRRGGRQGFPQSIVKELNALWVYYAHVGCFVNPGATGRDAPPR